MNQLIENRADPGAQAIIDACINMHNVMHDQTGIASFMRQHVVADSPLQVGPWSTDCWHTPAIRLAGDFVANCKSRSFDEAVSALQSFLCGDAPPSAPLHELVAGVLVQLQAEAKRAQGVFPKLIEQFAQLKAKWIAEHDAAAKTTATTILYLGNRAYRVGSGVPSTLTDREDWLLRAFIDSQALDLPTLAAKSGLPADDISKLIGRLRMKYDGRFHDAIKAPGGKGKGGYVAQVIDTTKTKPP
jgi:hypothetical protein